MLRIGRELLALLPVDTVIANAETKLLNTRTGHLEDQCIVSLAMPRDTMAALNFDLLDPSDSLGNFVHRMKFLKTKGFRAVDPIELADLQPSERRQPASQVRPRAATSEWTAELAAAPTPPAVRAPAVESHPSARVQEPARRRSRAGQQIRSKVSGVTYADPISGRARQDIIKQHLVKGMRLVAELEPDNPYGENAVMLIACPKGRRERQFHIGYIGSRVSDVVAKALREGEDVRVTVTDMTGGTRSKKTRGVNILIEW